MLIDEMHYTFNLTLDRIASQDKPDFEAHEIDSYINRAIWVYLKDRYGIHPENIKRGFETDQIRISQLSSLHIKSPHVQPAITPNLIADGIYEVNLNDLGNDINGQYFRYLFLTDGTVKASKDNCDKYIKLNAYQVDDIKTRYSESSWLWRRVQYNFGKSNFIQRFDSSSTDPNDPDTNMLLIDSNSRNNNDQLSSLYLDTRDKYGEPQFEIKEVLLSYIKYPNRVFFGGYDHIDGLSQADSPKIHCDLDSIMCADVVEIAARLANRDILDDYNAYLQDEIRDIKR
jgi:hypothetical protein